jgi:hypothetical protein
LLVNEEVGEVGTNGTNNSSTNNSTNHSLDDDDDVHRLLTSFTNNSYYNFSTFNDPWIQSENGTAILATNHSILNNTGVIIPTTIQTNLSAYNFLLSFGIEMMLVYCIYYPMTVTMLFMGLFDCCGCISRCIPLVGGRPYEVKQYHQKQQEQQQEQLQLQQQDPVQRPEHNINNHNI